MVRIFFTYVLPLIGPMLLYMAWNAYAQAQARKTGGEPPSLEKSHLFWSLIIGFVLTMAMLMVLAFIGGERADGGDYVPPRLEDGKIVPPSFDKAPNR